MMSDDLPLRVRSDADVQIAIYNAAGVECRANSALPLGLYRVRLERCGFTREEVILHDTADERSFAGPPVESPAPIDIGFDPLAHARVARELGALDERSCQRLGAGVRDARLVVVVRRMPRARDETLFSTPLSLHDVTGRLLRDLTPGAVERVAAQRIGHLIVSFGVPSGCYRLRVGRTRRDLAITVPAGRAAHVFIGDHGALSLRTARVYLRPLEDVFDPRDPIARATESVLWALSQPGAALPEVARNLISSADRDLSFGIACAHLARRQGDRDAFARLLGALRDHASELADVAIFEHAWNGGARAPSLVLTTPPLFRASFVLALDDGIEVAARSALAGAAATAHADSVWCTWSPRWWDERWIEPTVEMLRSRRDDRFVTVDAISRTSRLPQALVERALDRLDAEAANARQPEQGRETLFDRVAARGALAYDEACDLISQAFEALAYLHGRGITHGNIHPGTLLIGPDGHVVLDLPVRASRTLAREHDGTVDGVGFLAPAVAGGASPTPASDTWSMFATLYFLLSLELPRDRYADQSELEAARDNPIVPVTTWLPDLPRPLAECIERALAVPHSNPDGDDATARETLRDVVPASRAVRLYDELVREDPSYAVTLHNVFLRLSGLHGRGEQLVLEDVRHGDPAEDRRAQRVLRRFQAAGLITTETADDGGEPREYIKHVHDDLLRGWTRLCQWRHAIDSVPDTRDLLIALARAARRWRTHRRSSLLWSDRRVALARAIQGSRPFLYNAIESEFLGQSERRWAVRRAARVATLAGLVVVSGCVVWQHGVVSHTATARDEVQQTLARSLQEIGRQHVLEGRPLQALPYLAEASLFATPGPALQMLFHEASRGLPIAQALEHAGEVVRASFNLDGTQVVTAAADGTVDVWNASTGAHMTSLVSDHDHAHKAAATAASFSPDGRWIITASQDWTARIWDARTGKPVSPPLEHGGIVLSALFSRDGQHALTASFDHTVRVWNARTHGVEHKLDCQDVALMASFSADSTRVIAACGDGVARIWHTRTGAIEHELRHGNKVWSAVFSDDGSQVVTAGQDRFARIWDSQTGAPATSNSEGATAAAPLVLEHRDGVTSATFDRTGRYVLTTSDRTARVWDVATGAPITPWLEHRGRVNSAAFIPSGSRLVTASSDGAARIWDMTTGRLLLPLLEHTASVSSAMANAGGTRVITASADRTARIWDITDGASPVNLAFDGLVHDASFSPDGHRVATASDDNLARIWDVTTGKLLATLPHTTAVKAVSFHRDGVRVATVGDDLRARIWNTISARVLVTIPLPVGSARAAFSPDGGWLLTTCNREAASWASVLRIWSTETGAPIPITLAPSDGIASAELNRDRSQLVTLNRDRTVRVWNLITGKAMTRSLGQPGGVASVGFSPDGRRIITSGEDRSARIWDAMTGEVVAPVMEHDERVVSGSFSPDGARVVTISGDRTARLWDTATGKPLTPALRTDDSIVSAAFTKDGARLVIADRHTVRTVDVSLDTRSSRDWSDIAQKSPYLFAGGILVRRTLVPSDVVDEPHDGPAMF